MAAAIAKGDLPVPVGHSHIMNLYPELNAPSICIKTFSWFSRKVGNGKLLM
jgi:hypothetical protein